MATARKAKALNMEVLAYDPDLDSSKLEAEGFKAVDFQQALADSE